MSSLFLTFLYEYNILSQVQESSNSQLSRLEELKRRLEALNPGRSSTNVSSVRFLRTFK